MLGTCPAAAWSKRAATTRLDSRGSTAANRFCEAARCISAPTRRGPAAFHCALDGYIAGWLHATLLVCGHHHNRTPLVCAPSFPVRLCGGPSVTGNRKQQRPIFIVARSTGLNELPPASFALGSRTNPSPLCEEPQWRPYAGMESHPSVSALLPALQVGHAFHCLEGMTVRTCPPFESSWRARDVGTSNLEQRDNTSQANGSGCLGKLGCAGSAASLLPSSIPLFGERTTRRLASCGALFLGFVYSLFDPNLQAVAARERLPSAWWVFLPRRRIVYTDMLTCRPRTSLTCMSWALAGKHSLLRHPDPLRSFVRCLAGPSVPNAPG